MDTKLKSNNKSYLTSFIVFLVMIATAIGMFSFYPKIGEVGKEKSQDINPYENYDIQSSLNDSSYALYKKLLEKEENKVISPSDIFIKQRENGGNYNSNIDRDVIRWENDFNTALRNLDYYIVNNETGVDYSKSEGKLNLLASKGEINPEDLEELNKYYAYYMVVNYDEDGFYKITNVKGADKEAISRLYNNGSINYYQGSGVIIQNPKNVSIVYGIPENLRHEDYISMNINRSHSYLYGDVTLVYALIAFGVIVLMALIIPFKLEERMVGIKSILKIPFEIAVIIIGGILAFIAFSPELIYQYTAGDAAFVEFLIEFGAPSNLAQVIFYILNIMYWVVLFIAAFIGVVIIKSIFHRGIKKYFKENMIVGKLLRGGKRGIAKFYKGLVNIDLNDESNKVLIKVLGVNFIILSIMCSIWFFGIGISIAYTIVLFFILRKYFNDIKEKYSILLKATNKIAEGNLDVKIEEDLGVFEPFKGELEKIQSGFKKAVDEEVKSQKMKTELISNVSHDLKTPLTSIITYIDLLKDPKITEEDRKSYIDTLDRKSQRLKNLIEDLFEMSKATSRNVQLNVVDVDIVALMKQTQFELSDKIEASSLTFKWNFPNDKVIVPLDSQKTFRVFENLLMNIVKYSMENSRVYIDIVNGEEMVYVTLKNMSANEIDFTAEEIVERFARGDKSRNTEGSGLGLAISKSFVEIQGGIFNIEVDGDLFKVKIGFKK